MLKHITASAIILSILLPMSAFAQTGIKPGVALDKTTQSHTAYNKVTEYDFEKDNIKSGALKPDGAYYEGERHNKTRSIIKIRTNFIPELLKTVDNI